MISGAAHTDWVNGNQETVTKLYNAYKEAGDWVLANPDEAAGIIGATASEQARASLPDLIRANERLGLNVKWASDVKDEIAHVYDAGLEVGFLPSKPADSTIYSGK